MPWESAPSAGVDMTSVGERVAGTVKSFRGQWGFVTSDSIEGDIFIHFKDNAGLRGVALTPGEQVEFDLSTGGPNQQARAVNATRIGGADVADMAPADGGGYEPVNPTILAGHEAGGTLVGTIHSFRHGWGLIESSSIEGKLYFGERDNPLISEGTVAPGQEVTFELALNPRDGRHKAVKVMVPVKDQSQCVGQRVRGSVKSFQEGWGFVNSNSFSGSILLGRKQVNAAGLGPDSLMVGEPVEFEVAMAPNGKYEAIRVTKVIGGPMNGKGMGNGMAKGMGKGMGKGAEPPMMAMGGSARDRSRSPYGSMATGGGQGRVTGTVKTFRGDWGFIVSDQVQGDIFVKLANSPNLGEPLQQGESVSFELTFRSEGSSRNNGATAMNVQRANGQMGGQTGYMGQPPPPTTAQPLHHVQQHTMSQQRGAMAGGPAAGAAPQGGQHNGTVVTFKPAPDNWGWLEAPTLEGQVFFGLRDNAHLASTPNVGDAFAFELAAGPKGRPKAVNLAPSLTGQRIQGVVRTINDGWGFASADGIPTKVMLGKKALMASGLTSDMLVVGDAVEFELAMAAKGYEGVQIRKI